ncbi:MAG TPA: hypothetical protein VE998_09110 [Terriglobales bacterium]|nr:hypothetical protein [Terriglobales bacterium]
MRKLIFAVLVTSMFCLSAFAADNESKASVFAGYSYTRFDGGLNSNGFTAEFAGNVSKSFSLVGNFGGAYNSTAGVTISDYTYLFGPRYVAHLGRVDVFGHGLFGGIDSRAAGVSQSALAMGFGGGFNVAMGSGKKMWRLAEVDYLPTHFGGVYQKNIRVTTGLQINF